MRRSSLLSKVGPATAVLLMCLCATVFAGAYRTRPSTKTNSAIIVIIAENSSSCTLYGVANLVRSVLVWMRSIPATMSVLVGKAARVALEPVKTALVEAVKDCLVSIFQALLGDLQRGLQGSANFVIDKVLGYVSKAKTLLVSIVSGASRAAAAGFMELEGALRDAVFDELKVLLRRRSGLVFQALLDALPHETRRLVLEYASNVKTQLASMVSNFTQAAAVGFIKFVEREAKDLVSRALKMLVR